MPVHLVSQPGRPAAPGQECPCSAHVVHYTAIDPLAEAPTERLAPHAEAEEGEAEREHHIVLQYDGEVQTKAFVALAQQVAPIVQGSNGSLGVGIVSILGFEDTYRLLQVRTHRCLPPPALTWRASVCLPAICMIYSMATLDTACLWQRWRQGATNLQHQLCHVVAT